MVDPISYIPLLEEEEYAERIPQNNTNETGESLGEIGNDESPSQQKKPCWENPYRSTKLYITELSGHFSAKFLTWVALTSCFRSTFLIDVLALPLFQKLGIGASKKAIYASIVDAPMAMKPLIGVASDLLPIMGYNKRYAALLAILAGVVGGSVLIGIISMLNDIVKMEELSMKTFTDWIVICLTLVTYEFAALGILGKGKVSGTCATSLLSPIHNFLSPSFCPQVRQADEPTPRIRIVHDNL
jgi:hypothetical protein